jgi:hypothetical protein
MIHQAEQLYEQLVEQLSESESLSTSSSPKQHETALRLIRETLHKLKELVLHHSFQDAQEEITFFKHLKPKFTCLLIYHSRRALIELKRPVGSLKDTRRYFENELLLIRIFYEHHLQLYQYMLSGSTYLDPRLFARGNQDLPYDFSTTAIDTDTRFTTHYDYVVGRLQANERLRLYLLAALRDLENGHLPKEDGDARTELVWTGSKVHLIELAYALHESGQINGGTTGVSDIAAHLENLFHLKLGNVYRTFQEMRQRKKDSRTKFLDLMREKLEIRMDDLDAA